MDACFDGDNTEITFLVMVKLGGGNRFMICIVSVSSVN